MQSYTGSYAMSCGWRWEIPTSQRLGCGYVFNADLLSPEGAVVEIEAALGHKVEPLRTIKFDPGRLSSHWVENCVAIGLSSNFAEPLEATSIHSTITQMHLLVSNLPLQPPEQWSSLSTSYNASVNEVLDGIRDYLALHYVSSRQDSEYWRSLLDGKFLPESLRAKLDMWKHRFPAAFDFTGTADLVPFGLTSYLYVLDGLGLLPACIIDHGLVARHKEELQMLEQAQLRRNGELAEAAFDHRHLIDHAH